MDNAQKAQEIVKRLESMADPKWLENSKRLGIDTKKALGISIWDLRKIAKEIGKNQELAEALWKTDIHEARLLAGYIADSEKISESVIEQWVLDFNSWDLVDQVMDVIALSPFGYEKAIEYSSRKEEFVKRTGFVLMAGLSVFDKKAPDEKFIQFFPIIIRESTDDRNFVKKAVNWALRNIGKRNMNLNRKAIETAVQISKIDSKTAKWIASDALRELKSEKIQARFKTKSSS
jgi:3-methyladenine DNA glycosylase AlkD